MASHGWGCERYGWHAFEQPLGSQTVLCSARGVVEGYKGIVYVLLICHWAFYVLTKHTRHLHGARLTGTSLEFSSVRQTSLRSAVTFVCQVWRGLPFPSFYVPGSSTTTAAAAAAAAATTTATATTTTAFAWQFYSHYFRPTCSNPSFSFCLLCFCPWNCPNTIRMTWWLLLIRIFTTWVYKI